MAKRTLAAALLIGLATIGCSDYVMAPEEPRGDMEVGMTQPPVRMDAVKDGGVDDPRRVFDPQDS